MGLLTEIVHNLIKEDVSVDRVNDAINNLYAVTINYKSNGEDIANGKRLIQPHAYGLTKAGNPVIRAFQPNGDTTTKIPAWKFFRIDRIINWNPHPEEHFSEAPGNWPAEGEFNTSGDKTMSQVFNIANFNDTTGPEAEKLKGITVVGNINDKQNDLDNNEKMEKENPQSKSGENISQYPELYKNFQKSIENRKNQMDKNKSIDNSKIEGDNAQTSSNTFNDKQLADLQRIKDLMNKTEK